MSFLSDIYFWRQGLVFFADLSYSVNIGFMLSFPSLLNAAILSPNSTDIRATNDQASSIAGSQGLSGVIGFCFLPFLLQSSGRKIVNICINGLVLIGFLVFAWANNIAALYAARMIQGLSLCGVYVTIITLAEYTNAKRRGYFITLKKGSTAIGSLLCHSMGLFLTWRQVALVAIIPNIISIVMTFSWPESPSFLAFKGRYSECEESYKWLHGESLELKNDLEAIISAQMERRRQEKSEKSFKTNAMKFLRKDYLLPFVVVNLLTLIIDCCGRYYTLAYIIEIVKDITGDTSIATYCTIGSDLLTIVALACSCFIVSNFKRRQNLFSFGAVSVILMYLISIIAYLRYKNLININVWFAPIIILMNIFIVNAGVIPTCFAIVSEVFPIEHKGSGLCTTGIVFTLLYAGVMKFTPMLMEHTGVHGTFGIYSTLNLISFVILYFILIETKDKTLQEIENELKGTKNCETLHQYTNDQPLIKTQ